MSGRSSRVLGAGIVVVLAAAGFICAAPAQADIIHIDMTCDPPESQVVTITTKDTLSIVSTSQTGPCDSSYMIYPAFPTPVGNAWMNGTPSPFNGNLDPFPNPSWTMTFASEVPGSTHVMLCGSIGAPPICPILAINVVQAPEWIPGWQQSVGRASATATCATGWQPSWQEWAERITGGWVCTRTIPSLGN